VMLQIVVEAAGTVAFIEWTEKRQLLSNFLADPMSECLK